MLKRCLALAAATIGLAAPAMAQERIRISSEWGDVTAVLADNDAARALARMLPLTVAMRDHLRQEKTGTLPAPLPDITRQQDFPRQRDFASGTLGLWSRDHFVIYYRGGRVSGDVSIFDRPGSVTVRVQRAD